MSDTTIAGADALGDLPVFEDMGNEVLDAPETGAAPVVEATPAAPAVDPAAPATDPAPVVDPAPAAPAAEVPAAGKDAEPPVKGKPDFLDRLATKNRKIAALEEQLAAARATPAATVAPTPAAPAAPAAPAVNAEITTLRGQIADLRTQYHKAVMDGNTKEMAALDEQIDGIREQILDKQVESRTAAIEERVSTTLTERQQAAQLDLVVDELQAEYAELDADATEYDEVLVTMVNARAGQLMRAGRTQADSLRAAASEVMARVRGAPAQAAAAATPAPAARVVDTQKNLAAAAAQPTIPPAAASTASQVGKVDIMRVSEAEMAKWTEEDWARLRGDTLE